MDRRTLGALAAGLLGLVLAAGASSCALLDAAGVNGNSCTGDPTICGFCDQISAADGCEGDDDCGSDFMCLRGNPMACGGEFNMMLDHFRNTPSDCFNAGLPVVQAFLTCQGGGTPGAVCFQ